jgi:phage-related protein
MALNIGELVGLIRADDSGWTRGLDAARLRLRGLQRDAEGNLRDLRGRFVSEGEAAGRGLADGIGDGADEAEGRLGVVKSALRGIGLGLAGVSVGALGAAGALAAVPLAVIGLGAKILAENKQVKSAFSDLGSHVKSQLVDLAQPLVKPFVAAAAQLRTIFDQVAPHIGQAFSAVAPMIAPLVDGIGQFATGIMPGFVQALKSAQPVTEALADGLGSIGRGLGGFFAELSSGSGGAAQGLGALLDTVDSLLPVVGSLLGSLATLGGPILAGVLSAVQPLIGGVRQLAEWLGQLVAKIPPGVLSAIGAGFVAVALGVKAYQLSMNLAAMATKAWAAAQVLWNTVMAANPIGLVIGLIVGLVAIIVIAYQRSETFRAVVQTVWAAVQTAIGTAVSGIMAAINWLAQIPGKVGGWFGAAKDWAVRKALELVAWMLSLPGRVGAAISGLAGTLRTIASNAFTRFRQVAAEKAVAFVSLVRGIPGRARSALGNLNGMLVAAGRALIQGFINGIKSMLGSVKNAASGVVSAARNFFPFSPAKEGPFSGKGYTLHSGRALAQDFGRGITDQLPYLRSVMDNLPAPTVPDLSAPGLGAVPGGYGAAGARERVAVDVDVKLSGPQEMVRMIRGVVATVGGGDVQKAFGQRQR